VRRHKCASPLHPETEHLFNDAIIAKMKRNSYATNSSALPPKQIKASRRRPDPANVVLSSLIH
jgi:hypothetical protein